jgi:hypothetical protein
MADLLNVINSSTSQYNGPSSLPSSEKFQNIIKIDTLLNPSSGKNLGTYPAEVGYNIVDPQSSDTVTTNSQMSYIIPGNSTIIPAPLTLNRNYVLGIAVQLNVNRIVPDTSPIYLKKRYGQFKYVDIMITNSNLIQADPTGASFTINIGQIIA